MFKRILVPLDGSSTSEHGLDQAIEIAAGQPGVSLCLLHVVDEQVLTQAADVGADMVDSLLASFRASGEKIIQNAQAKVSKRQIKAETILVENIVRNVADVIVDQATTWRADLIVMGTHGRRGFKRVVMGSAAEGVVRNAPAPVLLVRTPDSK